VRCSVPSLLLNPLRSVDQGTFTEKNSDSARRAPSHVMPSSIACVLGHLTQNHDVVSSRSPRMIGSQFSSSFGGIRSGLVNTPADELRFISLQGRNLSPQHTDCSITARIVLFGQQMSTLVNKVGYIFSSELEGTIFLTQDVLSQETVSKIMQLGFLM